MWKLARFVKYLIRRNALCVNSAVDSKKRLAKARAYIRDKRMKAKASNSRTGNNTIQNNLEQQHASKLQDEQRLKNHRNYLKRKACETKDHREKRLAKARAYNQAKQMKTKNNLQTANNAIQNNLKHKHANKRQDEQVDQLEMISQLHEKAWVKNSIDDFHDSIQYSIVQCGICFEAWPIQTKKNSDPI